MTACSFLHGIVGGNGNGDEDIEEEQRNGDHYSSIVQQPQPNAAENESRRTEWKQPSVTLQSSPPLIRSDHRWEREREECVMN